MKINLDTDERPERKRRAPRTAFRKGGPNPHAFKPGESGRSRTKKPTVPDETRLISKALRAYLPFRAPDKIAARLGLPLGVSWAQVSAMTLLYRTATGDVQAIRAVHELSEGMRQRIGLGFDMGDDGEGENVGPRLTVSFVSARFQGSDPGDGSKSTITDLNGVSRVYVGDKLVETRMSGTLPAPPSQPEVEAQQPPAPPKAKPAKGSNACQPAPWRPPDNWRA